MKSPICCCLLAITIATGFAQDDSELLSRSLIAFTGTVLRQAETGVGGGTTVIVRVDGTPIKDSRRLLRDTQNVLVTLRESAPLANGSRAVFYARDVDFESLIHVYELGHQLLTEKNAATRLEELGRDSAQQGKAALSSKVSSSDAVFAGEVADVRPAATGTTGTTNSLASISSSDRPPRITEHEPDWHDAVVKVLDKIKGDEEVYVVRFPNSKDGMWRSFPKFVKGQKATFILKRERTSSGALMALPDGKALYSAPTNEDVLDITEAERLRSLMREQ
jgi:hypothetical protein